jgi:hypothetical protein
MILHILDRVHVEKFSYAKLRFSFSALQHENHKQKTQLNLEEEWVLLHKV